jgi:NitT/TauT family transport system substrate-binding protein
MHLLRVAATVAAFAILAVVTPSHGVQAQNMLTIHVGGVATDDFTPVVYAVSKGLYAKAGLDVQIVPTSSGTLAATAVVAGTYEMGKGSGISSMVAHLRGLPLYVIANSSIWDPKVPFNQLLVAADTPYKAGADLNGKTIGVPALNDLNTLVVSAWVDQNGGNSKTLKFVEIPNSLASAAIEAHRIDADALQAPENSLALATGKFRAIAEPYSAISTHFVFGIFFANKDWANAHPDAVRTWVRITYEAARYTNTHPHETEQLMSAFTKVPLETFVKLPRVQGATTSDPTLLQPFINAAAKYGQISQAFPAGDLFFH